MNGVNAAPFCVEHEVGHNYGLMHASTWPSGASTRVEYGDVTDVMGSARSDSWPYLDGMAQGDYQAVYKTMAGWLPLSRIVALHPHGAGPASGLVSNATFLLAALDRNNPIGSPPAYPSGVALAARAVVGPRPLYFSAAEYANRSIHVYFSYRSQATQPGLYLSEVVADGRGMSNPIMVCSEPSCTAQAPLLVSNDAFLYDRAGTRALISAANVSAIFPADPAGANNALQDTAMQLSVTYLGPNGRQLGVMLPPGCNATTGLCPSDNWTDATSGGIFTRALSPASPVALFRLLPATNGFAFATTCEGGEAAPPPVPVGLSAFFSGFPTSHAFWGGSVGLSGDEVSPGGSIANLTVSQYCANVTLSLRAGRAVWLVVGSPGAFRGTSLTATLNITVSANVNALPPPDARARTALT